MTTSQDIATRLLALSDDQFAQIRSVALDPLEMQLLSEDFVGVALGGQPQVKADATELPLVVAIRRTALRAWQVPRDEHALLAAMDLDTRQVSFGAIFHDAKADAHPPLDEDLAPPPKPSGTDAESVGAGIDRIDACAILGLPVASARYRFAAIVYDSVSNLVDVVVTGRSPRPTARVHPVQSPPTGDGGSGASAMGLRTYLAAAPHPPAGSTRPALQLAFDTSRARGVDVLLSGSVAVDAQPANLQLDPLPLREVGGSLQNVSAVIPVTIAVVGEAGGLLCSLQLAVPIYGQPVQPHSPVHGHFTVDFIAATGQALPAGTHLAYGFVEGSLFGPFELGI